jgi:hypothetical protein
MTGQTYRPEVGFDSLQMCCKHTQQFEICAVNILSNSTMLHRFFILGYETYSGRRGGGRINLADPFCRSVKMNKILRQFKDSSRLGNYAMSTGK